MRADVCRFVILGTLLSFTFLGNKFKFGGSQQKLQKTNASSGEISQGGGGEPSHTVTRKSIEGKNFESFLEKKYVLSTERLKNRNGHNKYLGYYISKHQ